jgi:purine-binding chemotaxis protein CheW
VEKMATGLEEKELKMVVFAVNGKEYALDIRYVLSIERMMNITRVPGVAPYIKGVINLRGMITPVIDLRTRFSAGEKEWDEDTRIIIVTFGDKMVGLIVDAASDVLSIPGADIEPHPDLTEGETDGFIEGVIKQDNRLFNVLKIDKVLNLTEER